MATRIEKKSLLKWMVGINVARNMGMISVLTKNGIRMYRRSDRQSHFKMVEILSNEYLIITNNKKAVKKTQNAQTGTEGKSIFATAPIP